MTAEKRREKKRKKNLSISEEVLSDAEALMKMLHFDDFSEFVSAMVRQEKERRMGYIVFWPTPRPKEK